MSERHEQIDRLDWIRVKTDLDMVAVQLGSVSRRLIAEGEEAVHRHLDATVDEMCLRMEGDQGENIRSGTLVEQIRKWMGERGLKDKREEKGRDEVK